MIIDKSESEASRMRRLKNASPEERKLVVNEALEFWKEKEREVRGHPDKEARARLQQRIAKKMLDRLGGIRRVDSDEVFDNLDRKHPRRAPYHEIAMSYGMRRHTVASLNTGDKFVNNFYRRENEGLVRAVASIKEKHSERKSKISKSWREKKIF